MHLPIKLTLGASIKLFLARVFTCCCLGKEKTLKKMAQMMDIGEERYEKETSIERIVKNLRDLRIHFKSKFRDESLSFEIQHNHKNVIYLDSEEEADPMTSRVNSLDTPADVPLRVLHRHKSEVI
mmetsp:Transcript_34889/g.53548  ORF Transcript_34889/g.53548 Transcript_34889/m.53548 type:complete len:125 (+) Transcript_34889:22-396(+)